MEINAKITGHDLVEGLNFYGETYSDERVVRRIEELSEVLREVMWELSDLHHRTKDRPEYSAQEINRELSQLRKDLYMMMVETEDVDNIKEVLYELGEDLK